MLAELSKNRPTAVTSLSIVHLYDVEIMLSRKTDETDTQGDMLEERNGLV